MGLAQDSKQAASWFRKAAEQGYDEAQYNLGFSYYRGDGVTKDVVQEVFWYRKAAEQGHAGAQFRLGLCYAMGEGVLKDEIEAYAYWSLAGATMTESLKNLGILKANLSKNDLISGEKRTKELQKEIEVKIAAKKAGK
jgi:TPR repeat protein